MIKFIKSISISRRRLIIFGLILFMLLPIIYMYHIIFVYTGQLTDIQDIHFLDIIDQKYNHNDNDNDKDWFNKNTWDSQQHITNTCPYWEDICIYNEHFWVNTHNELFHIPLSPSLEFDLFGSGVIPNSKISIDRYLKLFNASIWPSSVINNKNKYCKYEPVTNNMILYSFYSHMVSEYHHRVIRHLYYLKYEQNFTLIQNTDIKLYLVLADKINLFTTHYILIEPFSKYQLQLFSLMFQQNTCKCYKRLIFCGMNYNKTTKTLKPLSQLTMNYEYFREYIDIYPKLIELYNQWIYKTNIYLKDEIIKWKIDKLQLNGLINLDENNVNHFVLVKKWKFIGFYQRLGRRTWLNLDDIIIECNKQYNKLFIFCYEISFDSPDKLVHSKEIIIIHQATNILIGIHGSHFTNAVLAKNDGNTFLIELILPDSSRHAIQTKNETALSVIFRYSKINHIGMHIDDQIKYIKMRKFVKTYHDKWWNQDFMTNWTQINQLINYIIIDNDGYCYKYETNDDILNNIPKHLIDYNFVFYNIFCPNHRKPKIWHIPFKYSNVEMF